MHSREGFRKTIVSQPGSDPVCAGFVGRGIKSVRLHESVGPGFRSLTQEVQGFWVLGFWVLGGFKVNSYSCLCPSFYLRLFASATGRGPALETKDTAGFLDLGFANSRFTGSKLHGSGSGVSWFTVSRFNRNGQLVRTATARFSNARQRRLRGICVLLQHVVAECAVAGAAPTCSSKAWH